MIRPKKCKKIKPTDGVYLSFYHTCFPIISSVVFICSLYIAHFRFKPPTSSSLLPLNHNYFSSCYEFSCYCFRFIHSKPTSLCIWVTNCFRGCSVSSLNPQILFCVLCLPHDSRCDSQTDNQIFDCWSCLVKEIVVYPESWIISIRKWLRKFQFISLTMHKKILQFHYILHISNWILRANDDHVCCVVNTINIMFTYVFMYKVNEKMTKTENYTIKLTAIMTSWTTWLPKCKNMKKNIWETWKRCIR